MDFHRWEVQFKLSQLIPISERDIMSIDEHNIFTDNIVYNNQALSRYYYRVFLSGEIDLPHELIHREINTCDCDRIVKQL